MYALWDLRNLNYNSKFEFIPESEVFEFSNIKNKA